MRRYAGLTAAGLTVLLLMACGTQNPGPAGPPSPPGDLLDAAYAKVIGGEPAADGPVAGVRRAFDPAQALLIGPTYATRYDWTATTDRLTVDDATRLGFPRPVAAPAGQEIFLAHVAERQPGTLNIPADFPGATANLLVDGHPRPLDGAAPDPERTLVAVVPKGAPIALAVTDQGRTQTLDLRTGQRAADAVDLFYHPFAGDEIELRSVGGGGNLVLHGPLRLVPWTPKDGWAPAGQAFAVLDTSLQRYSGHVTDSTLDARRSFTLVAGGHAYPAQARALPLYEFGTTGGSGTLIAFAVPPTVRTGTIRLTPHAASCAGCRFGPGASASFTLAAATP